MRSPRGFLPTTLFVAVTVTGGACADAVRGNDASLQAAPEAVLEGVLDVLVEDADAGSRTLYFLVTGTARVALRFTGTPPALTTGTRIRAHGRREADGAFVVERWERVS